MKKLLSLAAIFVFWAYIGTVQAHEKWFTGNFVPSPNKPLLFTTWNTVNSSLLLSAFFGLLAAVLFHFSIRPHAWTRHIVAAFAAYKSWTSLLLRVFTGMLLFMAGYMHFLFAPDLLAENLLPIAANILLAAELIAGLGLIIGIFPRFFSAVGLILYLLMFLAFPVSSVLAHAFFVGAFVYLIIMGDSTLPKVKGEKMFHNMILMTAFKKARPYAMFILRFFTGLALIFAAFFAKIYEPGYALEFLRMHPVNFMPALGFANFTNEIFVLAAGLTEISIGLLIIFGILNRFIGAFLIVTFTLTLSIFGIKELLGHFPLYAAAVALVLNGGGEKWSAELPKKSHPA